TLDIGPWTLDSPKEPAMRLWVLALVTGLLLAAPARFVSAAELFVTPAHGNQYDRFVFEGYGFVPGDTVTVIFTAPNGVRYRLYDENDEEITLVVQADGSFTLTLLPVEAFQGAPFGTWEAAFYPSSGEFYYTGSFTIAPQA